jgi:hypothetical protein
MSAHLANNRNVLSQNNHHDAAANQATADEMMGESFPLEGQYDEELVDVPASFE